jgi:hypothetical protein
MTLKDKGRAILDCIRVDEYKVQMWAFMKMKS